ncbi:MAG: hypothetical protein GF341_01270 [candidate division Zixibacteria bacterium]|nr:hypothetical protein [candidate division Zixibacteria bacterium]
MKRCGWFLAKSCILLAVALTPLFLAADAVGACTPALSWQFDGAAAGDRLGYSVSGAGDVDNDGFDDVIVGAHSADPGGLISAGSAYVYSGQTGALLWQFDGAAANDELGRSVSGAGDVDNDGFDDLIVGAYAADPGGLTNAGSAYVYSGQTGALLWQFDGAAAYDYLGVSVSGAGDVDNDGFDDVIVGASLANPGGNSQAGSAYVYRTDAPTWYADADGDLYGDPAVTLTQCDQPVGYVTDNTDCDDTDPGVNPGAAEVCNAVDDNCDGAVDEGFDQDADGWTTCAGDCNDTDPDVYPGAVEVCNGIDDDCNGTIDDNATDATTWYEDGDSDGFGNASVMLTQCDQPSGFVTDNTDCDDTDPDVHPGAAEVCNGLDDNCDGSIDEGGICCSCPFQADFNADSFLDAVDLNALIDALFFNGPDPQDPNCPTTRGDFNNDGVSDATDLNALIDALFFNGPDPCDPCNPVQASCSP